MTCAIRNVQSVAWFSQACMFLCYRWTWFTECFIVLALQVNVIYWRLYCACVTGECVTEAAWEQQYPHHRLWVILLCPSAGLHLYTVPLLPFPGGHPWPPIWTANWHVEPRWAFDTEINTENAKAGHYCANLLRYFKRISIEDIVYVVILSHILLFYRYHRYFIPESEISDKANKKIINFIIKLSVSDIITFEGKKNIQGRYSEKSAMVVINC